jgi:predicted PurR-regulated permease PerM
MAETIITIITASGILGLAANYIVSFAKKIRDLGMARFGNMNPRVYAACASLLLSIVTVIAGGDADINQVSTYLEIISTALISWAVAHVTHKTNAV